MAEYRAIREVHSRTLHASPRYGSIREARAQSYDRGEQWHRDTRSASHWHGHGRSYQPLPYNYRSRSQRYATSEQWASAQRHRGWRYSGRFDGENRSREQRYAGSREAQSMERRRQEREEYSGFEDRNRYSDHRGTIGHRRTSDRAYDKHSGETERDEFYEEQDYGNAPGPSPSSPARSGGAVGHWTMSINAPESLDSWHGYGADCPDRSGE